jgi:hypothetical protein
MERIDAVNAVRTLHRVTNTAHSANAQENQAMLEKQQETQLDIHGVMERIDAVNAVRILHRVTNTAHSANAQENQALREVHEVQNLKLTGINEVLYKSYSRNKTLISKQSILELNTLKRTKCMNLFPLMI